MNANAVVTISTGREGDLPLNTDAITLFEAYANAVKPDPGLLLQYYGIHAAVLPVICWS